MAALALTLLSWPCGARADTATWNGGTGNWLTPGNWSTNTVPDDPTLDVQIDGGKSATASLVTLNNAFAWAHLLTVDAGDTFKETGTGEVRFNTSAAITGAGQIILTDSARISLGSSTSTPIYNQTLTLGPDLTIAVNNSLNVLITSSFFNRIDNQAPITFNNSFATLNFVTNHGSMTLNGSHVTGLDLRNEAGHTITLHGTPPLSSPMGELSMTGAWFNGGTINVDSRGELLAGLEYPPSQAATNAGTINLTDNSSLWMDQFWSNTGTINATAGSSILLNGQYPATSLAGINASADSLVRVMGRADNTGGTIVAGPGHTGWRFEGVIVGGTISVPADGFFNSASAILQSVTLTGTASVSKTMISSNGLTLADGMIAVAPGTNFNPTGTQTIGGTGTIDLGTGGTLKPSAVEGNQPTTLTLGPGVLVTAGNGTIRGAYSGNVVINQGQMRAEPNGQLTVVGVTNAGTIEAAPGSTLSIQLPFDQTTAGTLKVDGTLQAPTGGLSVPGGLLTGSGTAAGDLSVGGTIAPGAGIATFHVSGSLSLTGTSHYAADLSTDGSADMVVVIGDVNLAPGSTLDLDPTGNPPPEGTRFVLATYAGTLTGTFTNVTPGYQIDYGANQITATAVPEPAGALSLSMLAAVALLRRRGRTRER